MPTRLDLEVSLAQISREEVVSTWLCLIPSWIDDSSAVTWYFTPSQWFQTFSNMLFNQLYPYIRNVSPRHGCGWKSFRNIPGRHHANGHQMVVSDWENLLKKVCLKNCRSLRWIDDPTLQMFFKWHATLRWYWRRSCLVRWGVFSRSAIESFKDRSCPTAWCVTSWPWPPTTNQESRSAYR